MNLDEKATPDPNEREIFVCVKYKCSKCNRIISQRYAEDETIEDEVYGYCRHCGCVAVTFKRVKGGKTK